MTENRAISKAETTSMTLEDVLGKFKGPQCPSDEVEGRCELEDCTPDIYKKCFADFIREHKKELLDD